jgi:chemotaxis signal transduction protein
MAHSGTENTDTGAVGNEFLTFTLGKEEYGIDILKVQEIRGYDAVTAIANTPEFIKGVINLRGIIVPIVDMRIKFHLGKIEYDQFTVVIILNVANRVVGIGYRYPVRDGPGHGGRAHANPSGYREAHDQPGHGTDGKSSRIII